MREHPAAPADTGSNTMSEATKDSAAIGEQESVRYRTAEDVSYDDYYSPAGEMVHGHVTTEVRDEGTFGEAVFVLVRRETGREPWRLIDVPVLMTTESHWSGYSEYTITNEWSEIVISVPAWNWAARYPSLAAFFAALGTVVNDGGRR